MSPSDETEPPFPTSDPLDVREPLLLETADGRLYLATSDVIGETTPEALRLAFATPFTEDGDTVWLVSYNSLSGKPYTILGTMSDAARWVTTGRRTPRK